MAFRGFFFTLALALLLGHARESLAEIYRWTDRHGKVHFSDQPVSTDPQVVHKLTVPQPNLARAFRPSPNILGDGPPEPAGSGEASAPDSSSGSIDPAPKPGSGGGVAARSKESCQAKVAAYRESRACFSACAQPLRGGGTSTARCGHCVEQPMPPCWYRH